METTNFSKKNLAFNKSALSTGFDALNALSDQAVAATDAILTAVPSVPEEGKKAVNTYVKESQKALINLKKHLETGLEIDLTAKDAPVKSLEALENFSKDAFSQAAVFNKETKTLIETATKQLPKEAKAIINFWNESFSFGFESFQGYVNNNFALAKKVAADVFVVAPVAPSKAAK
ncbi:MAG: hypothetical protein WCP10_03355 [Desulfuromonadales bacterium]